MIRNTNDGTQRAPYLRADININSLRHLPPYSSGPQGDDRALFTAAKAAGFEGIEKGDAALCRKLGLGLSWSHRINTVGEVGPVARRIKDEGYECMTVHIAWGLEDDAEMDRLVDDMLTASVQTDLPIYVETHRATITQDMWRTVKLVERFPDLRFNGDFSHWHTGHEMTYGDIKAKWDFIQPVFDRTRYLHGRIGTAGCMQVDLDNPEVQRHIPYFGQRGRAASLGFYQSARPGDYIIFASELLHPEPDYARTFRTPSGDYVEEGDRWQQALRLVEMARECFEEARIQVEGQRASA